MTRPGRFVFFGATAVVLVAVQVTVPGPRHSLLWSEIFNAGHAPLYGVVALAIWQVLRHRAGGPKGSPVLGYLLALALTVAAGAIAEYLQFLGAGDADIHDVARDALGAGAFLLAASAFDHGLAPTRSPAFRPLALLGAAVLLGAAFVPLTGTVIALVRRDLAFPTICDFDGSWQTKFVGAKEGTLERTSPPAGWAPAPAGRVGRVGFAIGTYPGLAIGTLHPNWLGYKTLVFDGYSELPQPVKLVFSIHDIGHEQDYHDRFNRELTIQPGANHISIPLQDIRMAPRGRQMDLSRMCGLVLFADHPSEAFVLYVDGFHLE